jgi:hypothetical protein
MTAGFVVVLWIALSASTALHAEQPPHGGTESTVPALLDFHEVIYPIWHDAYPAKNYSALRGYAPRVKEI